MKELAQSYHYADLSDCSAEHLVDPHAVPDVGNTHLTDNIVSARCYYCMNREIRWRELAGKE